MSDKSQKASTKREAFEILYRNLTALQSSYQHLIHECAKQLGVLESLDESSKYDDLNKNMQISKEACTRLERLKYHCALAILSEGSSISEDEISRSIEEASYLLEVAEIEITSSDEDIRTWALTKKDYLQEAKEVLLEILSFKIDTKVRRGLTLWQ